MRAGPLFIPYPIRSSSVIVRRPLPVNSMFDNKIYRGIFEMIFCLIIHEEGLNIPLTPVIYRLIEHERAD